MRTSWQVTLALVFAALLPAAASAAAVQDSATAPDGLTIAYDVRGEGDVALVFVHCWACDRTYWSGQLDVLSDRYRVVSLDLGGHGQSGAERVAWTLAGLAGDVVAVVDALQLQRIVLVGHSMGGPVSLMAAGQLGDRVAGVVVVDTLHDLEAEVPDEAIESFAASFEKDFAGAMEGAVRSRFGDAADGVVADGIVERAVTAHPVVAVALMRDFRGFDPVALVTGLDCPIRAINASPRGEGDPVTAVETNRKHCDFDAVEIEGVGHFLQLEKPDEVNQHLAELLEGILQPEEPDATDRPAVGGVIGAALPIPEVAVSDVVWRTNPPPKYPARAKRKGQTGEVVLHAVFGADGAPIQIDAVEGPDIFVPFAVRAVEQWRAEPVRDEQGSLRGFRLTIRLMFTLD